MGRILSLTYGVLAYLVNLAVFVYAIGFVGDFGVPRTLDTGPAAATATAVVIDVLLLLLFAVQHSVMARDWFKERWTKVVPKHLERSTYVLVASLVLAVVMWAWRPIPETVWSVSGAGATALWVVFGAGWLVVFITTGLIDHFDLFGLRHVWLHFKGREYEPLEFQEPGFYKYVRHPLYLGFLMAFWAIPEMTIGHLLFAVATTGYILVAVQFEERDLLRYHGDKYARYRERVPMLLPIGGGAGSAGERGGSRGPSGGPRAGAEGGSVEPGRPGGDRKAGGTAAGDAPGGQGDDRSGPSPDAGPTGPDDGPSSSSGRSEGGEREPPGPPGESRGPSGR